jgi:hypothetical protein
MGRRGAAALVLLLVAGLAALSAPPAPGATCTAAAKSARQAAASAYAARMAKGRAAYFATHKSAAARRKFVAAQKARLAALRRAAGCTVRSGGGGVTTSGPLPAPPPATNEHFAFSDEMPQAARDEIEQDVAYAVQDENAILGVQFGDVTVFASTDPSWLGHHQCDFLGHSDSDCYDQTTARFASGHDAGEGGPGELSLNWHQGDLVTAPAPEKQKIIAHELFHALQFQLDRLGDRDGSTPPDQVKPSGPVWLLEGAAEMVGYRVAGDRRMLSYTGTIANAHDGWRLVPPALDQTVTLDQSNARGAPYQLYMVAADRLAAIAPDGLKSVAAYYAALGTGVAWADAFVSAFGLSVDDFYANFAAYLKSG